MARLELGAGGGRVGGKGKGKMLDVHSAGDSSGTVQSVEVFDIEEFGARLRKCITGGANGPLIVAGEVMRLADSWAAFRDEADGLTCTQWLIGVCGAGKGLAWWKRRADAVVLIGESCRRVLDHDVAVYLAVNVPSEKLSSVFKSLVSATKENSGNPLSLIQARVRVSKMLGKIPRKKTCACCRRYEALLVAHGIDLDEQVN